MKVTENNSFDNQITVNTKQAAILLIAVPVTVK